jgi:hypothetical protein
VVINPIVSTTLTRTTATLTSTTATTTTDTATAVTATTTTITTTTTTTPAPCGPGEYLSVSQGGNRNKVTSSCEARCSICGRISTANDTVHLSTVCSLIARLFLV